MIYLLDTCVVSEFIKTSPELQVIDWFKKHDEDSLYLSALSLGELRAGIVRLPESKRRTHLEAWFDALQQRFSGRTLDVSPQVALAWGNLRGLTESRGRTLSAIDSLIAATARVANATVVTRNVKDFEPCGVPVFNPWPGE